MYSNLEVDIDLLYVDRVEYINTNANQVMVISSKTPS